MLTRHEIPCVHEQEVKRIAHAFFAITVSECTTIKNKWQMKKCVPKMLLQCYVWKTRLYMIKYYRYFLRREKLCFIMITKPKALAHAVSAWI